MTDRRGILGLLAETWPARTVQGILGAMALPGDVYAGRVDPMSDEAIGRAAELTGILGTAATAAPRGALGSGMVRRNPMEPELPMQQGATHVYHGTGRTFDDPRIGSPETTMGSFNQDAFYVTRDPSIASGYAEAFAGPYRQNTEGWAPQVIPYRLEPQDAVSLPTKDYFLAKRAGVADPDTLKGYAKREREDYLEAMLRNFGEKPHKGESFPEFAKRMGAKQVWAGDGSDEIMLLETQGLLPRFAKETGGKF